MVIENNTRNFSTGATRDIDDHKPDFESALSPVVLEAFARYMVICRLMPDGTMRDDDNWQKGMPLESYMKSGLRHFMEAWKAHRDDDFDHTEMPLALLGLFFNVQGYLHEYLKKYPHMLETALFEFERQRRNAARKDREAAET